MGGGTGVCAPVDGAAGFGIEVVALVGVWASTGVAVTARDCDGAGVAGLGVEVVTAGAGDCEVTLGAAGCGVGFEAVVAGFSFGVDATEC